VIAVLRELAWLEGPVDLVRLLLFLLFAMLVAAAALRPSAARSRAVVGYALAVTSLVGISQQESWPFTQWALVSHQRAPQARSWDFEAMDASGRAFRVDPRVLQPLSPEEFGAWALTWVPRLPPAGRDQVGAWLLARAEEGRRRVRAGLSPARNERLLGPLAAPYHFHEYRPWRGAEQVPARAFLTVRLYVTGRRVLLEYRRPAGASGPGALLPDAVAGPTGEAP